MGNCENPCRTETQDGKAGRSGDLLQDKITDVMAQLENMEQANTDMMPHQSTDQSNKEGARLMSVQDGMSLVQFENGGMYEGTLR